MHGPVDIFSRKSRQTAQRSSIASHVTVALVDLRGNSGRKQSSIGILPVGRVAAPREYRLEAYAIVRSPKLVLP